MSVEKYIIPQTLSFQKSFIYKKVFTLERGKKKEIQCNVDALENKLIPEFNRCPCIYVNLFTIKQYN